VTSSRFLFRSTDACCFTIFAAITRGFLVDRSRAHSLQVQTAQTKPSHLVLLCCACLSQALAPAHQIVLMFPLLVFKLETKAIHESSQWFMVLNSHKDVLLGLVPRIRMLSNSNSLNEVI
jgi:hypothetical protein